MLSALRRSWGVKQRCLPAQAAKSKRADRIKNAFRACKAMRADGRKRVEVSSINDGISKHTSATKHFIRKGFDDNRATERQVRMFKNRDNLALFGRRSLWIFCKNTAFFKQMTLCFVNRCSTAGILCR